MINEMLYSIQLWGEDFVPANLELDLGIDLDNKRRKGSLVKSGRYKGKRSDFGCADFNSSNEKEILKLLRHFSSLDSLKVDYGIDDISIHVDVHYTNQCNFEISKELIQAASKLGICLSFSCY